MTGGPVKLIPLRSILICNRADLLKGSFPQGAMHSDPCVSHWANNESGCLSRGLSRRFEPQFPFNLRGFLQAYLEQRLLLSDKGSRINRSPRVSRLEAWGLGMNDWFEAEQRVERAQQLSESHCFAEALAELEVALAINPNNALWQAQRGFLLEELDRSVEAIDAYEKSLLLEPGDQDVSLALGAALTNSGRFARALEVLEGLARLYPDLEPAYCNRIQVYAELGRHEQAEEMFYLAQDLDDACPHCFFHMGGSLFAQGRIDRAIFCWERVLELEPSYIGVNRRIAQGHYAKGELGQAREYFIRELRDDPGNTNLLFELGDLALELGQLSVAAAKYEQIIELDPRHGPAHLALGSVLLQMGKTESALVCLESAASFSRPEDDLRDLDARTGEALLRLGRHAEARRYLERAVELAPGDAGLVTLLGDVLLGINRTTAAADCYRRALAIDANHAVAHHKLALTLIVAGRPADALRHDLHALRSRTGYGDAMHSASLAMLELGRWGDARRMLDQMLLNDPDNADLLRLRKQIWRLRTQRYASRLFRPLTILGRGFRR